MSEGNFQLNYEEISQLNQRKENIKRGHNKYLESHPEVSSLLNDFLSAALLEKPKDVYAFATKYFRPYNSGTVELPPLVIAGPSGVGKGTLISMLQKEFFDVFSFSVSHTTRGPRPGERDGVNYHYVAKEAMVKMIDAGEFIEHADVYGNFYGTSVGAVQSVQSSGCIPLFDIDVQGVLQLKKSKKVSRPNYIFISPPSLIVLEDRLRNRKTESEESIQSRLAQAAREIDIGTRGDTFDYTIVNDDLDVAYSKLRECVLMWYPQLQK